VGVAASEGAGIGANDSVGMTSCSVMQGHDGPLNTSSQPVRNMPTSSVVDSGQERVPGGFGNFWLRQGAIRL
jgi:hypothetical protein